VEVALGKHGAFIGVYLRFYTVCKGLFQGKIDENILKNKGYTKKTI